MTLKMVITPLFKYQIAETKSFEKIKKKIDKKLYSKIENFVYPQLKENYLYVSNIKKLFMVVIDFRRRQQAYD